MTKLLGMFSSHELYKDWCIVEPDGLARDKARWNDFVAAMRTYYKPTENHTLKHFHFRSISQNPDESFPIFFNRVEKLKQSIAISIAEVTAARLKKWLFATK